MKRKPTGFVAVCQCGVTIGAMDFTRTGMAADGRLLGKWLADGCTVTPRFGSCWSEAIKPCQCDEQKGWA